MDEVVARLAVLAVDAQVQHLPGAGAGRAPLTGTTRRNAARGRGTWPGLRGHACLCACLRAVRPTMPLPAHRRWGAFAFCCLQAWPLDAQHRIVGHSIGVAEMSEQQRKCRELAADGGRGKSSTLQVTPPSDEVCTSHDPELLGPRDAVERHEVGHVNPVGPPRAGIVDVGESLQLRRYLVQALELGGRQRPAGGRQHDSNRLTWFSLVWLMEQSKC